jgi:nitrate/TMAO reductase-like tetraheme cytochrome c subunit
MTLERLARIVLHGTQAELEAWARDYQAKMARRRTRKAMSDAIDRFSRTQREENWQRTRATALARAAGRCEMCHAITFVLDVHHLAPGPLRRKYEAPNAVIACCRDCHRGWHKGALIDLTASLRVAEQIGAPDIVQANLNRRIQRVTP